MGQTPLPLWIKDAAVVKDYQKPHVTRSIKIQCPFRLTAKLDETTNTWVLHHVRVGHNHGPADTIANQKSVTHPTIVHPPETHDHGPADTEENQNSVTLPTIVYPPEIHSCATRIQQLSPRRQIIVLEEVNKIIDQHSAMHSITSPLMVKDASLDEEELDLALKFLNALDESGSKGVIECNNPTSPDNGLLVNDQAQLDKENRAQREADEEKTNKNTLVQAKMDANEKAGELSVDQAERNMEKVENRIEPSKVVFLAIYIHK
ncbi:uncharacterized protein MELLADRAFT_69651 [Melampsora larici-populina 98AG31]|uniref:Uncharacterized protein n=1 Tax=Melampsora larici-populina (strain 98AG31 / pathotype 3-4-7) TaxID=747676 RepID=F4SBL6_MELLP|nr:uncharacterized protein MELLADRAFT_69651 [Melampsora larici-populina 98AG31]EGF97949.1 hypothetical protein MELLADRAFT_69651 [Melampsora larici-populina 98AG31]